MDIENLTVLVDSESAPLVEGAQIDYIEGLMRSGFVISNPNVEFAGGGCGGGGCACGRRRRRMRLRQRGWRLRLWWRRSLDSRITPHTSDSFVRRDDEHRPVFTLRR